MYWSWGKSGLALGLCFLFALVLVKPIGVSTQFVILDGVCATLFSPGLVVEDENSETGYNSPNAYLAKSGGKYAKSVAKPMNYSFIFVVCMLVGGFLGALTQRNNPYLNVQQVPIWHQMRFGGGKGMRMVLAFVGGVLVLTGARLAGGCTSGHMMSGMIQTAVSGYLFALAAFVVAVPTAIVLYKR